MKTNFKSKIVATAFAALSVTQGFQALAAGPGITPMQVQKTTKMSLGQRTKLDNWYFIENQGQLRDENQASLGDIKYYLHYGGLNVYCRTGKISFVFSKQINGPQSISEANGKSEKFLQHVNADSKTEISRTDLIFEGANIQAKPIATDRQPYHENYYLASPARPLCNVPAYGQLTYKEIYPHIDLILVQKQGAKLEYAFLVHPGGNVSDIKMRWEGTRMQQLSGTLMADGTKAAYSYTNALGTLEESEPRSFSGIKEIACAFTQSNGLKGFRVGNYDQSQDLLIDPTVGATYYDNISPTGLATDGSNNLYISVQTSNSGLGTSGTFQSTYSSGGNAFLAKMTSIDASPAWATYYGTGSNGNCVAVTSSGTDVFLGGSVTSGAIATAGAFQTTAQGGGGDGFVADMNGSDGTLNWGTYYGTTSYEEVDAIATDGSSVYIGGLTEDASGTLASSGAYQTSLAGGGFDVFVASFAISGSGARSAGTMYGGTNFEELTGITLDGSGNIYITGATSSTDGIAQGASIYQNTQAGSYDAFVAKFSNDLTTLDWGTYYGGGGDEFGLGISTDGTHVYITGSTTGSSGLNIGSVYQTAYGGGGHDAFLANFSNSDGSANWATYFGGTGDDIGAGIVLDGSSIYITGTTNSSSNIASGTVYQNAIGGGLDFFLAKFNASAGLTWGSYFGGSGDENVPFGNYTPAIDGSGNVYLAGTTNSTGFSTPGAYQSSGSAFIAVFNSAGALPVSLTNFNAYLVNSIAKLNWTTASETNNNYFGIERSADAQNWTSIGKELGHGNAMVANNYLYLDNLAGVVPSGVIYYRLKQVDFNGAYTYSPIRAVSLDGGIAGTSLTAYPNPAKDRLMVSWQNQTGNDMTLKIIDINGAVLYSESVIGTGDMSKTIDMASLASGTYFLQVVTGSSVQSKIVYKQ